MINDEDDDNVYDGDDNYDVYYNNDDADDDYYNNDDDDDDTEPGDSRRGMHRREDRLLVPVRGPLLQGLSFIYLSDQMIAVDTTPWGSFLIRPTCTNISLYLIKTAGGAVSCCYSVYINNNDI